VGALSTWRGNRCLYSPDQGAEGRDAERTSRARPEIRSGTRRWSAGADLSRTQRKDCTRSAGYSRGTARTGDEPPPAANSTSRILRIPPSAPASSAAAEMPRCGRPGRGRSGRTRQEAARCGRYRCAAAGLAKVNLRRYWLGVECGNAPEASEGPHRRVAPVNRGFQTWARTRGPRINARAALQRTRLRPESTDLLQTLVKDPPHRGVCMQVPLECPTPGPTSLRSRRPSATPPG